MGQKEPVAIPFKLLSKESFVNLREALCALRGKILKALTTKDHKGNHKGALR